MGCVQTKTQGSAVMNSEPEMLLTSRPRSLDKLKPTKRAKRAEVVSPKHGDIVFASYPSDVSAFHKSWSDQGRHGDIVFSSVSSDAPAFGKRWSEQGSMATNARTLAKEASGRGTTMNCDRLIMKYLFPRRRRLPKKS
mmetsp:Transcript_58097/g.92317  ORF Transcript_58097/g.92317 Transcript_58097/m.92317 type:complete len:138 (-) Transcript_58097:159-572(-)